MPRLSRDKLRKIAADWLLTNYSKLLSAIRERAGEQSIRSSGGASSSSTSSRSPARRLGQPNGEQLFFHSRWLVSSSRLSHCFAHKSRNKLQLAASGALLAAPAATITATRAFAAAKVEPFRWPVISERKWRPTVSLLYRESGPNGDTNWPRRFSAARQLPPSPPPLQ